MVDRIAALVLLFALTTLGCWTEQPLTPRVGISAAETTESKISPATIAANQPTRTARTAAQPDDPDLVAPLSRPQELRGAWVTRWTYDSAEDVRQIMNDLANAGFNTVYFQVRGTFDAYYHSNLEPWAARLSAGDWDPLAVAIEAGHARGLQIHAYLNTFPLWNGPVAPVSQRHAYHAHPEWRITESNGQVMTLGEGYLFASPGIAAVRQHVATVAADIASRYAVDGIHLDYIRYPGQQYSSDPESLAGITAAGGDRAAWQRNQVTDTVRRVNAAVDVPVTAAVWGIYENRWNWNSVSEGNVNFYQDSAAFLATGAADATLPMIYWPVREDGGRLDFRTLVRDHLSRAHGRHIYAGVTAERGYDVALACAQAAREEGAQGVVLFDYRTARDAGWLQQFGDAVFNTPAVVPRMPWRE